MANIMMEGESAKQIRAELNNVSLQHYKWEKENCRGRGCGG